MYIFLDESYNLKDRSKPQLISISGFIAIDVNKVWKRWREYRRKFAGKWRIHATDGIFEPLREKAFRLAENIPDITLLSVVQLIPHIPVGKESPYYRKGKLNFDKVYEDMLKSLLEQAHIHTYNEVVITIDSRKMKEGRLGKKRLQEHVLTYFREYYSLVHVEFRPLPSSSSILLEMADFISNTLYRQYIGEKMPMAEKVKGKTIVLKNPLK